ncbi:MAG TPA: hypothetical protein VJS18_17300, partial [Paraburkholderia sp.]|nr:hypothetical protein [Paraburkholderia sp.]
TFIRMESLIVLAGARGPRRSSCVSLYWCPVLLAFPPAVSRVVGPRLHPAKKDNITKGLQ